MIRDVVSSLMDWQISANRRPLLVRGARQVGKSYCIRKFGEDNFSNLVEINFESQPKLRAIFEDLDPVKIVRNLSLATGSEIVPGKSILFLDEIQECPQAIVALRYFFEKLPELHVIGAGSLLEFVLHSEEISVPVGRVQYLYLYPLSFYEFLEATGNLKLREFLTTTTVSSPPPQAIHQRLVDLVREYLVVGGMPACVDAFVRSPQSLDFQRLQTGLLQTYRDDFGKYASLAKHKYLSRVFDAAPALLGEQVKYSKIDRDTGARELKDALFLLEKAGIIARVCATSAHGLPFAAHAREEKFKVVFLDVGLAQRALGIDSKIALSGDLLMINAGGIAEQFVGQELRAFQNPYSDEKLYYWSREERNSSAEVDFLLQYQGSIVGVEVKAGSTGRLKSLRLMMNENQGEIGVRVSQLPLSFHEGVLSVPLYMVAEIPRLLGECTSGSDRK